MKLVRAGTQIGELQSQFVKRTPVAAMQSMCGVTTSEKGVP